MKPIRIFINGFGRIGRAIFRIAFDDPVFEIVGINDIYDFEQMRQLLQYDSVYGTYKYPVFQEGDALRIKDQAIPLFCEADPTKLRLEGVDLLLQCTGLFLDRKSNQPYLDNGAETIIISAPASPDIPTYVTDINHKSYRNEPIISASSCSSAAILPILKLTDNLVGVQEGSFSMFHSYTAYQKLLDVKHYSKDIRRARSATQNIQPLQSSAQQEAEKFFPHLKGKLYAKSIRVPVDACTLYDLTLKIAHHTTQEALNQKLQEQMNNFGALGLADPFCVSRDIIGSPCGALLDLSLTQVIGGDLIKIMAWQDNEYGYAYQLLRLAKEIA